MHAIRRILVRTILFLSSTTFAACGESKQSGFDPERLDTANVSAYCEPVLNWNTAWQNLEGEIIQLVNEQRAKGADCHTKGMFKAAPPVALNELLRCAARNQSVDMDTRKFFDHENPDHQHPWDRMTEAGYDYVWAGENIAEGYITPEAVMLAWMASDGHCANIMKADFTEIGVGYFARDAPYWTQVFGSPMPELATSAALAL